MLMLPSLLKREAMLMLPSQAQLLLCHLDK
jgi:hypothetical protein